MPRTHITYFHPRLSISTRIVEGWDVIPTSQEIGADIRYERYTQDYRKDRDRPFMVGKVGFASLKAAVMGVLKNDTVKST